MSTWKREERKEGELDRFIFFVFLPRRSENFEHLTSSQVNPSALLTFEEVARPIIVVRSA